MAKFFIFRNAAEASIKEYDNEVYLSSSDVTKCDIASCEAAERILSTAMGEVQCYRDKDTTEVVVAWWIDEDVYEGSIRVGHPEQEVNVRATPGNVEIIGNTDLDEYDMEQIALMFVE